MAHPDPADRVSLVTGGGSGIGRAACHLLAEEAGRVAVLDLDAGAAAQTADDINAQFPGRARAFPCDVGDAAAVSSAVSAVVDWAGQLHAAINAAGIEGPSKRIVDYPDEDWHRVIRVNLDGAWYCTRNELAAMLPHGYGAIVNVSSTAGLGGGYRMAAYSASKHGVIGITRTAAIEYGRSGIRVNAVCPGFTLTPMIDRFTGGDDSIKQRMLETSPLGRGADPAEVAAAAVWLCSDAASFVNGAVLAADGGFTAA